MVLIEAFKINEKYKDLMLNKIFCLFFWELSLHYKQIFLLLIIKILINETLIEFIDINYVHVIKINN